MRVSTDTDLIDLLPGGTAEVGLDIVNTGDVIDGITARVVGLPAHHVSSRPAVLPLFPESSGRMTLVLGLPAAFPAGTHPVTVEVRSRQPDTAPSYLDLDLQVPASASLEVSGRPQVIRTRRSARFVVTLNNRGNIALDVVLEATDAERAVATKVLPATVTVPAGSAVDVVVSARAPRMILGTETDRPINVLATGRPVLTAPTRVPRPGTPGLPEIPALPAVPPVGDPMPRHRLEEEVLHEPVTASAPITVRQRPWLTRGLLTSLILLSIIALWAAVFLFGIGQVFGKDPLVKTAPASFFAGSGSVANAAVVSDGAGGAPAAGSPATGAGAGAGAGGTAGGATGAGGAGGEGGTAAGGAASPAPAGALPKNGTLPSGQGGVISGTVTAASSKSGAGRILVEALRRTRTGALTTAGSAATQADGSYEIAGLFPGSYLLRFSADGFVTSFAPSAKAASGAKAVAVTAASVTGGANGVITGKAGTITGSIDPGDTVQKVVSTVTVLPITGTGTKPLATAKTDGSGKYVLRNVPAPGSYRVQISTPGYLTSSVKVDLDGGAQRLQPTIILGAASGTITGVVSDGTKGLGGVTVMTTVAGAEVKTGTPNTGTVGRFVLGDLPTPATYVLTLSAEGYTTRTIVVDLKPGQQQSALEVELVNANGQVGGRLVDKAGAGLGGATVTVGGGPDLPGTMTLTSGSIGSFSLANLPRPGSYTLTFSLAGYADQTIPLILDENTAAAPLDVVMTSALGRITGRITDAGGSPVADVAVVATDGVRTWPVTSTASSGVVPAGGYVITGLAPGTYTVTATGSDGAGATALVTVPGDGSATQDFRVGGG